MYKDGPFHLRVSKDLRKRLASEIMRRICCAVADAKLRDQFFLEYSDQVYGLTGQNQDGPWEGAADIDAPITGNQFLTLLAMLWEAFKRDPQVMVEGAEPDDQAAGEVLEPYLTHQFYMGGITQAKWGVFFYSLMYPLAISRLVYQEKRKKVREVQYKDPGTGLVIPSDAKEEGVEYEEVLTETDDIESKGISIEAVDTCKWYIYPSDHPDIQTANGCGEYQWWTEDALLQSIKEFGCDRKVVEEIIALGPDQDDESSDDYVDRSRDGVEIAEGSSGKYKVFTWYCRLPILRNAKGDIETPEHLWDDDFCMICCPKREKVLRFDFSPCGNERPYDPSWMLRIPGKLYGWCLPDLLDAIQCEANATWRFGLNIMNFVSAPVLKVKKHLQKMIENKQIGPGTMLYVDDMDDIEPLQEVAPSHMPFDVAQRLEEMAATLVSGGSPQIGGKVRKAEEVKAQQQSMASKFGLYASCEGEWLEKVWRRGASVLASHADDDEEFVDEEGMTRKITPQQIKKKFIFRPTSNSMSASPEHRLELDEAAFAKVMEVRGIVDNPQASPDTKIAAWHMGVKVLTSLGVHDADKILGPVPTKEQAVGQPGQPGGGAGGAPIGMGNGAGKPGMEAGATPLPSGAAQG